MDTAIHVVKFGSGLLTQGGSVKSDIKLHTERLLKQYKRNGLIVVSSGAVAIGGRIARELGYGEDSLGAEQLAGMGFAPVFSAWQEAFASHGVAVASTGITHHQLGGGRWYHRLGNRSEKRVLMRILRENAEAGIVTVLNESDMISNTELMRLATGGDNDGLAARVAIAMSAETLTIYSEHGGIFDANQRLVSTVDSRSVERLRTMLADRAKSAAGKGGVLAKADAAWAAACAGVNHVSITDVNGKNITRFVIG